MFPSIIINVSDCARFYIEGRVTLCAENCVASVWRHFPGRGYTDIL